MDRDDAVCPRCGYEREAGESACSNCGQMTQRPLVFVPPQGVGTGASRILLVLCGIVVGVPAGLIYTFCVALAIDALTKNLHAPVMIAAQLVPFGLCFYFALREVRRGTPFGAFLLAFGFAALLPTAACDVWLSSVSW